GCLLHREPTAEIPNRALADLWIDLRRDRRSGDDIDCFATFGTSRARPLQTSRSAPRDLGTHGNGRTSYLLQYSKIREIEVVTMKQLLSLFSVLIATAVFAEPAQSSARVVDFKSADGTVLKGTYFAAAKPGPGVLLLHQSNRDRKSWDAVAGQLANAGINTLT